jgi:hypothetical protein
MRIAGSVPRGASTAMGDSAIGGTSLTMLVLAAQALASSAMCGVIWFVQVVHYPLFGGVDGARAAGYAIENQRRTSRVVLPFMIVELAAAVAITVWPPPLIGREVAFAGLALVVVLWASTLIVQVPLHGRLARDGHAPAVVAALVRTNWLRTIGWTARAILAVWMVGVVR